MKPLNLSLLACLFLIGCASTSVDYSAIQVSGAKVSDVKVSEIINERKNTHKLRVSFGYEIENFNEANKLYSCTIQFVTRRNGYFTQWEKRADQACSIDKAQGQITVVWKTPNDKDWDVSRQGFVRLIRPHQYFIAIHQKTGETQSTIISRSPCYQVGSEGMVDPVNEKPNSLCANNVYGIASQGTQSQKSTWTRKGVQIIN